MTYIAEAELPDSQIDVEPFRMAGFFEPRTDRSDRTPIEAIIHSLPKVTNLEGQPIPDSALKRRVNDPKARRRTSSLLVLLARLGGVSFEDCAVLLGRKPEQLNRLVHADISVPERMLEKIRKLDGILRDLHLVLEPSSTQDWLSTPVPDLKGRTPLEAIVRGRINDVALVTKSYVEPHSYL